ncbi:MAG TPA: EamA family transporter [Anaeromyxobacteraceae bacterium]|nr:EamA family transporter [Anaeromyxobacteraceae bacterium]
MAVLAYAVCALVWGTTWYAIRVCIGPGGYPSFLSAAVRFTVATAILAPILRLGFGRPRPDRRAMRWLAVCGVLNAGGYALVYRAEEEVAGGVAAVLFGTMPLVTAAIARLTGTERLRPSAIAGALAGLTGIAVIFRDRMSVSAGQGIAVALILGSVACASTFTVLVKRHASRSNPVANMAVFFPATAAALWLLWATVERQPLPSPLPLAPTAALLYLAVFGSVITFGAYFYLVRHVSLATVTTLVLVEPVIALLVDALFEHRAPASALTYVGAAITASGVLVAIVFGEQGKASASAPPPPPATDAAG